MHMRDTTYIIGEWLEQKRNEKGLSLQEAADGFGYSKSAIHTWEKGKRAIPSVTLINYSFFLGADLNELTALVKKEHGAI